MESLSGKLAKNLNRQSGSIFSKTMIITQGGGMNDWLTRNITENNGVFAHYAFQNQDGFLGQVYELLTEKPLRSNRDAIKFGVYGLLDSEDFKNNFKDVASYYEGNPLRRIQLAEKIADLFDQYQLYREAMIRSWEAGQPVNPGSTSENWQMWLWQQLKIPSKATLRNKIYELLGQDASKLKQNFPEIHLFGISIYTNFHLDFYKRLSEYIPVHFYLCLPSQNLCLPSQEKDHQSQEEAHQSQEEAHEHSLLESFGTKAKELLEQFAEMNTETTDFPVMDTGTLLGRLQQSIVNNEELTAKEEELTEKDVDDSIQVTSHFTPVREVEALYNYLLDLFEKDKETKSLKPRDVLVITPDINKYEPFIKAVFRNAPVTLPNRVSGAAKNTGDSITASLELIVNMSEEDLTSEKVAGLLEQNRIGKAYRVEDTSYIRGVLNKAGIRFGRENSLHDDTHYVSWKYGLEKIILGYAMLTEEAFVVSEEEKERLGKLDLTNYPYPDAEASASYDLLRLKAFVDDLQELFDAQQTPRTLAEWKLLLLQEVMEKMVWSNDFSKEDRQERNEIYRALGFTEHLDKDVAEAEVPWTVFVNELKKRLFTESREHELNSGAITFTSAIPARGLPYKVIAFIGLDNGVFPRQDHHLGFDLMGNDYQAGDRSKKEADKSLFLDTLMAAREKLYLSYIGQSVKDNTEIPPSIVLDTLMDYLGLQAEKHPLHGFSNRYNDNELFTYLYNTPPDPNVHKTKETASPQGDEKPEAPVEEIWVDHFVKFFEAPIDWYFNKVLGIKYDDDEDDTLPETELFELDYLQQWKVKSKLLKFEGEINDFIRSEIQQGNLPLKNLGHATVEELSEKIEPLKQKYLELTQGKKEESVAIDLTVDGFRITGIIEEVFGSEYISCNLSESKRKEKNLIRTYLRALLLYTSEKISKSIQVDIDGTEIPFPIKTRNEAIENLKSLVKFLKMGKESPLKFTLKALRARRENDPVTIESVLEQFKSEADGSPNSRPPFPGNKYLQILFDENYFEEFTANDLEKLKELARLLNLNVL